MSEESDRNGAAAALLLPSRISLRRNSAAGPLARGTLTLRAVTVPLFNDTAETVIVNRALITPLTEEETGLAPATEGAALSARTETAGLEPGHGAKVEIAGTVPARPGAYAAELRVSAGAGQAGTKTATAPVSIAVAASPAWGFGCLVLGLVLLAMVQFLSREGGVQEKIREVERFHGDTHAWLQREPPPQGRAERVAEIDRDLDEALTALSEPRSLSVVDRRVTDAQGWLSAARGAAATLRDELSKSPPGALEIAALTKEWSDLQNRMGELSKLDTNGLEAAGGLASHTAILMHHAWERLIGLPLRWVAADLAPQLERVQLAEAAGETDRARAMALATRAWLRRAAHDLDRRLALMMGLKLTADEMVVSDAWVRQLAAGDELPPDRRSALLERLAAADAALAKGASLADLAAASGAIAAIETDAYRDQSAALQVRVQAVADAAGEEMSAAPMEAVMNELRSVPHPSGEQKAAVLFRMLEVWRGRLGVVRDADTRARLAALVDRAEDAARHVDLSGTMAALHELEGEWQAYLPRHVAEAGARAVAEICGEWRDRNLRQLVGAESQVKLQSGRPEVEEWERELDRARRGLLAVSPEHAETSDECLGPVVERGRAVVAVSRDVFTHELGDVPIPLQARLDAAETSGVTEAIALVRKLMTEPRDLKLVVRTRDKDRVVHQPLVFALDGLDPDWASSVAIVVYWGDGTARETDAEKLRQGDRLEHAYETAKTFQPVAMAADHFRHAANDTLPQADGPELGRSTEDVLIEPSPASAAERLADTFLTTEFALSLLIASVVYLWRYMAGSRVFGARGVDYMEAFAMGFVAYAAVTNLPDAFTKLLLK